MSSPPPMKTLKSVIDLDRQARLEQGKQIGAVSEKIDQLAADFAEFRGQFDETVADILKRLEEICNKE